MRSDGPLIKHLCKAYNPKLGVYWQKLPLVELGDKVRGQIESNWDTIPARNGPDLDRLAWNDVVFDLGSVLEPDSGWRFHMWIRATAAEEWLPRWQQCSPWAKWIAPTLIDQGGGVNPGEYLIAEIWSARNGREFTPYPATVAIQRQRTWTSVCKHLTESIVKMSRELGDRHPQVREAISNIDGDARWAPLIHAYLAQCPEYLVEEVPEVPAGAPPRRHNDPKPWTYNYLPRIILLDPMRAPSGEPKPDQGGTHASPRPHQRRGHWATLKAARFYQGSHGETHDPKTNPRRVFVKPAWVGPREWIMFGNHYRVLDVGGQA